MNTCCSTFARALKEEIDNEEYGALIYTLYTEGDDRFRIGCESLPPMSYCPWCGVKLL